MLAGFFVVEELGESYLSNDDSSEDRSSEDGSSGGYFSEDNRSDGDDVPDGSDETSDGENA